MKKFILLFIMCFVMFGFNQIQALNDDAIVVQEQQIKQPEDLKQSKGPVKTMQKITNSVESEIKKNKNKLKSDPKAIYGIVDRVVLPHVDFEEMAKWIAGKSVWNSAKPDVQSAFINEFKTLVVSTYATTLNRYNNEEVEFLPLQKSASNTRVQVSSKIHKANNEILKVDYRLLSEKDGWKLYDIIIEGVSLLKGFQAQFSEKIRNIGLEKVTKEIRDHNIEKNNESRS